MDSFLHIIQQINQVIWGLPAVIILIGTGIYLTTKFRFIQWRGFKHSIALVLGKYNNPNDEGEISHFRALMTGLSATIGTGNIAGVATAIMLGGPGAIFWMWVSAIFGMASKFASCTLAVKFRQIDSLGEAAGGPMYTILHGLKKPKLAAAFALLTMIAAFGLGNTVQANSIVNGLNFILPNSETYNGFIGILLAFAVGCVTLGGIKRIGRITSLIVPIMAGLYLLAGTIILIFHAHEVPHAFATIFNYAFNPHALGGGMVGAALQFGTARGVFSNEAGLGSSAMAHAAAKTNEPVREGLVAMLEPFIDTLIVCTLTGLLLIVTHVWQAGVIQTTQSTSLSAQAFSLGFASISHTTKDLGSWIVAIGVVLFAYSSMISWSYYGDRACLFLFGQHAVFFYRILFIIVIFFGAIAPLQLVWQLSDLANICMAIPNLISLILLAPLVKGMTEDYFARLA